VDDLESFYHTAQWAAAFNDGQSGKTCKADGLQHFRTLIAGPFENRTLAERDVMTLQPESKLGLEIKKYGPFFGSSAFLLHHWLHKLCTLQGDWEYVMGEAEELEGRYKEEFLVIHFLIFGLRGVKEYFQLLLQCRDLLNK